MKMRMRIGASVISAGLVAAMMSPIAHADKETPELKFCHAMERFTVDVSKLEGITSSSTIGELKSAAQRVSDDADQVEKRASKMNSQAAKQFSQSVRQLRSDIRAVRDNRTIEQAKSRISDDIDNVKRSGQALADEAGCPSGTPAKP